jgi:hypothetical protein
MMATASIHLLRTHKMNLLGRVVGCASFAGIDAELLCLVELSLLKNVFGVGIGGGRSWNMYFGSGQYIGDVCDGCKMNGNSGLRCM